MINRELTVIGNHIGSYGDLVDLMDLDRRGRLRLKTITFPLDAVNDVLQDLTAGRIFGRAVLVP